MNKTAISIIIVIILVVGVVLAMNSTKDESVQNQDQTPAQSKTTGEVKEFVVEGNNFKFAPTTLTVKKGDRVRVVFKNTGGLHDFVIDEFQVATKQIQGNTEDVVEFVADKAGQFEYYCSVGQHRQMGMKGTLTVQE